MLEQIATIKIVQQGRRKACPYDGLLVYLRPVFIHISQSTPYQQWPDEQLVQQYRQSADQQVLAVLYQRYNGLVLGVCLKYLKDAEAAADAALDIYEELVSKVTRYEIDNFKGWLHTLTRNHCLMKLRSGKGKQTVELPEGLMQSEEMVHLNGVMEKEEHLTQLEQCIDKLSVEQRQVVQLFYLQEKCYNDITELTGLPWNIVRSHIQNGRRNLKICMDQYAR
jgi:RNA polymerase sigma factor (sigma-70 family)